MQPPPPEPRHVIAALAERGPTLELQTVDICFLAALHLRAERAQLASFAEDALLDVFEQVADTLDPLAGTARQRANHAIRRLREQRLLARIDGAGVLRAGEYVLTRLAVGIVEFHMEDDALTSESLTLLTRTLTAGLVETLAQARRSDGPEAWARDVVGPLRITLLDLVQGIERRQRGFDLRQEEFQGRIAKLIGADWFGALERCQSLLDTTSETLRELNQVLLRDTHQIQALLQQLQELAIEAAEEEAEARIRTLVEQVDRVAAWGAARQRAWSDYHQYVHRYLRDVVRLDPARALSHRLREQLAGRAGRRFSLVTAHESSIRLLRPVEIKVAPPPVKRPKRTEETTPTPDDSPDPRRELEARVRAVLAERASGLAEVTARVTRDLPESEHFVASGQIAEMVAKLAAPRASAERPWEPVGERLVIEEWAVSPVERES